MAARFAERSHVGSGCLEDPEPEQSEHGGRPYRNDRLIAVADGSTERGELRRLKDLDDALMTQTETFFTTYDKLTGKAFRPIARHGRRRARTLLDESQVR